LLFFLFIFVIPFFVLYFVRYKQMQEPVKEDAIDSREFWMLIGSLVLVLSAVVIILKTSTPVFNEIFDTKIAPPEDPEFAHNQVQIFVAIIIGALTAIGQFLKYKTTPLAYFKKQMIWPVIITILISIVIFVFVGVAYDDKGAGFLVAIYIAIVTSVFAIVGNISYWSVVLKGKLKSASSSIGHIGFGLVLAGIFISSANKTTLSYNTTGISPLRVDSTQKNSPVGDPRENLTLFETIETDMGKYNVTYERDTFDDLGKRYFELNFKEKKTGETFKLYPDVLKNNKGMEGFSANPSSKHYLHKDIFVYVTSFQDHTEEDTTRFNPINITVGDSIFYSNGYIKLEKVNVNPPGDRPAGVNELRLQLNVVSKEGLKYVAEPGILLEGLNLTSKVDTVKAQNLVLSFNKVIDQEKGILEIGVKESASLTNLITLKVYEFPWINLLWLGVIVTTIGFMMGAYYRFKK
jgi:cytochrome c-type biogenesis protein CcmF